MADVQVVITGDEAKFLRSMANALQKQGGFEAGFSKLKSASKTATEGISQDLTHVGDRFASFETSMGKVSSSIGNFASSFVSPFDAVNAVLAVVDKRIAAVIAKQQEAAQLAATLSPSQSIAAINLGTADPEVVKKLLTDVVPRVATQSGFPDLQAITDSVTSLASTGTTDVNAMESAMLAAASLTRENPSNIGPLAAAAIRVMKSSGLSDAEEAISLIGSSQALTPVESIENYGRNLALAQNASQIAMKDQPIDEVAKQTTALFATLAQAGGKPTGDELTNFIGPMIGKMDEFFEARADDPKSLMGRIGALQADAGLRNEFMDKSPSSAVYSIPLKEILTDGTKIASALDENLTKVTTDRSVFRNLKALTADGTDHLAVTSAKKNVEARIEANKFKDLEGSAIDAMFEIREKVMKDSAMTTWQYLGTSLYHDRYLSGLLGEGAGTGEGFDRYALADKPDLVAHYSRMALQGRLEALESMEMTPKVATAIATVKVGLESIEAIEKRLGQNAKIVASRSDPDSIQRFDLSKQTSSESLDLANPFTARAAVPSLETASTKSDDLARATENLMKFSQSMEANLSQLKTFSDQVPTVIGKMRDELRKAEEADRRAGKVRNASTAGRP